MRENFVQGDTPVRLQVSIPASNAAHISFQTLITNAVAALQAAGATDPAASLDVNKVLGVKVSEYAPGANAATPPTGANRAAIMVADGLASAGVIDMSRAEHIPAGVPYMQPAHRDWTVSYPVSETTAAVPALLILIVVKGA